jgi:hypothetical protein
MTDTVTPLVCGECGEGNYYFNAAQFTHDCTNPDCDHSVTRDDIYPNLEEGERLTIDGWLLAVASA